MISESDFMGLVQGMYGSNYVAVVIYECPLGTLFNSTTCLCDYPENVDSGTFYPELYMILISTANSYQVIPYPYGFHPSEIVDDPEYPNGPIGGVGGTADCAGVAGGTAHMESCGCIGGTTGISDCNQMCSVSATMAPIQSTVRPGTKINLATTIYTTAAVTVTDKRFDVWYRGEWHETAIIYDEPAITQGNTFTYNNAQVNVLGELRYRLKITYTCNGVPSTVYSNVISTYSQYTSANLMAEFSTEMASCWSQTVASSVANQGKKYEYGFSAYFDCVDKKVSVWGSIVSTSVGCGTLGFGVTLDERPTDQVDPTYGADFTVGNFHTHPPLTYCSSIYSLVPGPSSLDLGYNTSYPRIARTYSNTVTGGHNINLPLTDHLTHSKSVTDY